MAKDESSRNNGSKNPIEIKFDKPFTSFKADMSAWNHLISANGILMMHYMAVPDPMHQVVDGALRMSFDQEENYQFENKDRFIRENGFLYIPQKPVYIIFTSNSKNMVNIPAGLYGDGGASATINRYYKDTDETVKLSEYDKFVPQEITTEFFSVNWQKFTHNPTGIDRLQFEAETVEYLIDSQGIVYTESIDFIIEKGQIRWLNGNKAKRPGLDPISGKGKVCSIRYTYKPSYYVKVVHHDIRMMPTINPVTGEQTMQKAPISAQLQADWVFLNVRAKAEDSTDQVLEAEDTPNTGLR